MQKSYHFICPKCNNKHSFYKYGKDSFGSQKYKCRVCKAQFVPDSNIRPKRKYPTCPRCGKTSFIHHDYDHYSNYRCSDKHCTHSFFAIKSVNIASPSMSKLFSKTDFKRMRYPVQTILMAITMFFIGKNSFRNISEILRLTMNIKVSHTTISNCCTRFAPLFDNISIELIPQLNFDSDEWHADETVVKVKGIKY